MGCEEKVLCSIGKYHNYLFQIQGDFQWTINNSECYKKPLRGFPLPVSGMTIWDFNMTEF